MPLGEDVVDGMKNMKGNETSPLSHTNDVTTLSSQAASRTPSSFLAIPSSGGFVVTLDQV